MNRINSANGYLMLYNTTFTQRYYIKDHLGNNRMVVNGAGAVYQNNNCYPYGGMTALGSDQGYQQFKYNGKEYDPMHGLDEYDYGARQYDPAIGRFTTIDPLCEKYYHISPYTYCAGNPVRFVDLSGKEPTPAEAARIALQVYGEKVNLIGNWTISARTFKYLTLNTDNGLKSQIYERTVNGQKEYVYATAGTKTIQDWEENIKQPLGVSVEFHESAENARKISEQLGPDVELTYVGHSQGGGEAALNSLLTEGKGRKAITFNASGVGILTKLKEGGLSTMLKSEKNINAYILLTDPLNTIQNSCSKLGIGLPDVNGLRHYLWPKDWKSILVGHSMTNIMKNF